MCFCRMRRSWRTISTWSRRSRIRAQYLQMPVWLEGYTPPSDPRLRSFSLTPDPGVLEVNLPPASNWDELEQINTLLFEEAREEPADR